MSSSSAYRRRGERENKFTVRYRQRVQEHQIAPKVLPQGYAGQASLFQRLCVRMVVVKDDCEPPTRYVMFEHITSLREDRRRI